MSAEGGSLKRERSPDRGPDSTEEPEAKRAAPEPTVEAVAPDAAAETLAPQRIAMVYSPAHVASCDRLPAHVGRSHLVHDLIRAYGLVDKLKLISPARVRQSDLERFHAEDYVKFLAKAKHDEEHGSDSENDPEQYGLKYDCELFEGVYSYATAIVGGTLACVDALGEEADVILHWDGGRHHARSDCAAGYCYFNDIVICILQLLDRYPRIMYIDIDIHHGDGVEEAFAYTNKVMTVSFHKYGPGFFPGTGAANEIGGSSGKYYTVNVPIEGDGFADEKYCQMFDEIIEDCRATFAPDAVVLQCGADGLTQDELGTFNLTPATHVHCMKRVLGWRLPTIVLGGGGYNVVNVAKAWTQLTAAAVGVELPNEIPEHENFDRFGPDFTLRINPGLSIDTTEPDKLAHTVAAVHANMAALREKLAK